MKNNAYEEIGGIGLALQGAPWKSSSSHMKIELAKTLPEEDIMAKM